MFSIVNDEYFNWEMNAIEELRTDEVMDNNDPMAAAAHGSHEKIKNATTR